jgi:hypothetical protein
MPFIVGGFAVRNKSTQAGTEELRLAKDQIDHPAAAYMLACRAAMVKDFSVVTAGFFQGVGKDGYAVEGSVVVDGLGQLTDGAMARCQPSAFKGSWSKGKKTEDIAKNVCMLRPFLWSFGPTRNCCGGRCVAYLGFSASPSDGPRSGFGRAFRPGRK